MHEHRPITDDVILMSYIYIYRYICHMHHQGLTYPRKKWLENYFPFGEVTLQGLYETSGVYMA